MGPERWAHAEEYTSMLDRVEAAMRSAQPGAAVEALGGPHAVALLPSAEELVEEAEHLLADHGTSLEAFFAAGPFAPATAAGAALDQKIRELLFASHATGLHAARICPRLAFPSPDGLETAALGAVLPAPVDYAKVLGGLGVSLAGRLQRLPFAGGPVDPDALPLLLPGDVAPRGGFGADFLGEVADRATRGPGVVQLETPDEQEGLVMLVGQAAFDGATGEAVVDVQYVGLAKGDLVGGRFPPVVERLLHAVHAKVPPVGHMVRKDVPQGEMRSMRQQLEQNEVQLSLKAQARRRVRHGKWFDSEEELKYFGRESEDRKRLLWRPAKLSFLRVKLGDRLNVSRSDLYSNSEGLTVEELKAEGNRLYAAQQYRQCVRLYAAALNEDDTAAFHASLHANTAQCYLHLKQYPEARSSACKGLVSAPDPKLRTKLIWRRAQASEKMGMLQEAESDASELNFPEAQDMLKCLRGSRNKQASSAEAPKPGGFQLPSPKSWAIGLSPTEQQEWLVDCYRLRVDDEYVFQGELRGLYNGNSHIDAVYDFLLFAKLCVASGVVPNGFDWQACLRGPASRLLRFAFEKSDAREKYGGENVFAALMESGRSLRYTGEKIFGSGIQAFECGDKEVELREAIERRCPLYDLGAIVRFAADVGGEAWRDLWNAMPDLSGTQRTRMPRSGRQKKKKKKTTGPSRV